MPMRRFAFGLVLYGVPSAGAFPATPLILRNITLPLVVAFAPNCASSPRCVVSPLWCRQKREDVSHPPSLIGAPDVVVLALVAADNRHGRRTGSPRRWCCCRRRGRRRGRWWRGRTPRPVTAQIALRDPFGRVGIDIAGLPQDERQLADIAREQDLLCLLGRGFHRHRLGDRRLLLSLARELIDREHLHVMQENF